MQDMRAVSYKEIDGIKIVLGVGDPVTDPEATFELARLAVASRGYRDKFHDLIKRGKSISADDVAAIAQLKRDVVRHTLDQQLAVRDHARAHPVYFAHVPGETLVTVDHGQELEEKLRAAKPHERLTLEGFIIKDNRGKVCYCKQDGRWKSQKIERLGDNLPDGYTWAEDMSDLDLKEIKAQHERDYIDNLPLEDRRIQAALEIEMRAKNCADLRSTLEIKGESRALEIAREQFEKLKAEIIKRYKLDNEADGGCDGETRQTNGKNECGRTELNDGASGAI